MGQKHKIENSPAQRDSGNSKLGKGVLGILRSLGILGEQPKKQYGCAQRDSGISNLRASRTEPQRAPAQRGSKNSNLYLPLCLAGCQASPAMRDASLFKAVAQQDSGMSKFNPARTAATPITASRGQLREAIS